jgi:hypothetical protein
MVNYNNSMIYKICCRDTEIKDIYIGSTTNFIRRKCAHKGNCNNPTSNKHHLKLYQFIREHGGWTNWAMVLVEAVSCETKLELHKIERQHIEQNNSTLNCKIPARNKKEYRQEYREKYNKKSKKYYHENKEEIDQRQRQRFKKICEIMEQERTDEWAIFIKQFK